MNITFLVGNGFDLGLGLKTQYNSFYEEYLDNKGQRNILEFKEEIAKNIKQWSDFETAFGKYCKDKDKKDILEQFEDFVETFVEYLKKQEGKIQQGKQDEVTKIFLNALKKFYDIRTADKEVIDSLFAYNASTVHKYRFISFNYTKCLDMFVSSYKNVSKEKQLYHVYQGSTKMSVIDTNVVHVHGYTEENMIMGVNDILQIDNESFRKDEDIIEEIVKPRANVVAKMNYDVMATKLIKESQLICIYGMSLGETDKKWWELIINWLRESDNRRLIILQHDEKVKKDFLHRYSRAERNLINKFLSYLAMSDDWKQKLKQRIHVEFNHDVFALNLVGDEEIKKSTIETLGENEKKSEIA